MSEGCGTLRAMTIVLLLLALLVGVALGWLAAQSRSAARIAALQTQLAEREASELRFREAFAATSAQALRDNNDAFLTLADARWDRQAQGADASLARREQSVQALLGPVGEALARIDAQLRSVESTRQQAYGGLLEQVQRMHATQEALRTETAQLVAALRAPQVRGRWGEMQLRRVVEAAGAVEHVHFREQVHIPGDGGALRPDMVVDLADGKQVVVDAKVPFAAWLAAMEARDEQQRSSLMADHARQLAAHVKALGDKAYWRTLPFVPEFVVLFVPADAFLDAALRERPDLLDEAFARDVVLATPSTLVALLRTIGYCWRTERLADNTQAVSDLASELYSRLGTLGGHVDKVGAALGRAVGAYNEAVGSLETRVLVSARKLAELHVSHDPLLTPRLVTEGMRPVTAPELTQRAG